jgi:hypothetical protein
MKIRAERIICYINDGISLFKVNDLSDRSYLIISKAGLSAIIKDSEKLNDEQLKIKIKNIINNNDKYYLYRGVKEIIFEA